MNNINSFENRIFKLSTGEKVSADVIEKLIEVSCLYIKYVVVSNDQNGDPVALLFPNKKLLTNPDYQLSPEEGCFCPRNLDELGKCLTGCLKQVNNSIEGKTDKIKYTAIIKNDQPDEEMFSTDDILKKYKLLLQNMYGGTVPPNEEVYIIKN
jgi:long-subunit acyl-CoA synthetase (AMP-forming)